MITNNMKCFDNLFKELHAMIMHKRAAEKLLKKLVTHEIENSH